MMTGAPWPEREDEMLAMLAERTLALVCDLQDQARSAADADERVKFASAFHRVARGLRQTLALKSKLTRDRHRLATEVADDTGRLDRQARDRRKDRVRLAVERAVWSEYEGDEAELLVEELDARLEDEVIADGFLREPVEAHIARLREELGLSPEDPGAPSGPAGADRGGDIASSPAPAGEGGREAAEGALPRPERRSSA